MSPSAVYKLQITLSRHDVKWLILWSYIHGKPRASYAAQIISARVEANIPLIQSMIADAAADENMEVDEFIRMVLDNEGFPTAESPSASASTPESE